LLRFLTDRMGHEAPIYAIAYDQARSWIYSADGQGWIVRWSTNESDTHGLLVAKADVSIMSLIYVETSSRLIAGDLYGYLHVIDPETFTIHKRILAHPKGVFSMVLWENFLITCGGDGKIMRWRLSDMILLDQIDISKVGLRSMITCGDQIYMGDGNGYIYQLGSDLRIRLSWQAHRATVFALEFVGDVLISGGRDAQLCSWDHEGRAIHQVSAHWYTINKIICVANNLVTLSRDKKIRLWSDEDLTLVQSIDFIHHGHLRSVNNGIWIEHLAQLWTCGDDRMIKIWTLLV
jgi:WD40 repeat protein